MTKDNEYASCPINGALNVFAGRWKPEILWHLRNAGSVRFNQLQRSVIGVSQKMLTQQLRELERDGLVKRIQYQQIPPKVEYEPTGLAASLEPIFSQLELWFDQHAEIVAKAQVHYDNKKT